MLTSTLIMVVIATWEKLVHGGTITVSTEQGRYTRFQMEMRIVAQPEHQYA